MTDFVIFAGTTEGRRIAEEFALKGLKVAVCVATEYGKNIIKDIINVDISAKRMDKEAMAEFLLNKKPKLVIDATHPYAGIVSENIVNACKETGIPYYRLLRSGAEGVGVVNVASFDACVDYLNKSSKRILLTTGSKDLDKFTKVKDYHDRIYVRVLPTVDALEKCEDLGYKCSNIIAMQGPFTTEFNTALIKANRCEIVVTKDSGKAGGFFEKLEAADKAGAQLVVIGRPFEEKCLSYEEIRSLIYKEFKLRSNDTIKSKNCCFPVFFDMSKKRILIVGGGKIGTRRAKKLVEFGIKPTILSKEFTDELKDFAVREKVILKRGDFYSEILSQTDIVIAATDNRGLNKLIGEQAKSLGILVNIADKKEESDFWFPAAIKSNGFAVGMISENGKRHKEVAENIVKIKQMLGE